MYSAVANQLTGSSLALRTTTLWCNRAVLLREALQSAIARLTDEHVPSPRLNAETLLMFTLNCDRAHLYAHPERELTAEEQSRYDEALTQRAKGVPAQYITGHQEFWGLDLIVSPAVLIPRPETEHLIETVLPLAKPMKGPKIADVGTGSGAIALALAKELPNAEIHATDNSPAALEIAEANAARLQLEFRVEQSRSAQAPHLLPRHRSARRPRGRRVRFRRLQSSLRRPVRGRRSPTRSPQVRAAHRSLRRTDRPRSHRKADSRRPRRAETRRLSHHGNQRHHRRACSRASATWEDITIQTTCREFPASHPPASTRKLNSSPRSAA